MIMRTILVPFSIKFDLGRGLWGSLGLPWSAFGPRSKKTKKNHFLGHPFWQPFSHFFLLFRWLFFVCFLDASPAMFWVKKHLQASISSASGYHVWDNLNKSWKVETTIPYESGHENQVFEACVFFVFVHFVSMYSRRLFFWLVLRFLVRFHIFV